MIEKAGRSRVELLNKNDDEVHDVSLVCVSTCTGWCGNPNWVHSEWRSKPKKKKDGELLLLNYSKKEQGTFSSPDPSSFPDNHRLYRLRKSSFPDHCLPFNLSLEESGRRVVHHVHRQPRIVRNPPIFFLFPEPSIHPSNPFQVRKPT